MEVLQQRIDERIKNVQAILDAGPREKDLTKEQADEVEGMFRTVTALKQMRDHEAEAERRRTEAVRRTEPNCVGLSAGEPAGTEWRDAKTGVIVPVRKPSQRFADLCPSEEPLSVGRLIVGIVRGRWDGAEAERRAMSGTVDVNGGFLVPNPLSARVIDLARA